jgi:hypothetical protein
MIRAANTRRLLIPFLGVSVSFVIAVAAYAIWARIAAVEVIESAAGIHSTADAEREVSLWQKRRGFGYVESSNPRFGDVAYQVHADNRLLHRVSVLSPTFVGMTIDLRNGQLNHITVVMFSGRDLRPAGVWIQEWFGSVGSARIRVNDGDKPLAATVDLSSGAPEGVRRRAFALNVNCFVELRGCRAANEILPHVWEIGA